MIVKLWINVFKDRHGKYSVSNIYAEEEMANNSGQSVKDYFKTVSVEFEDNEVKEE